ncbi:hypothetical protein BGZ60DRAFT_526404 [Tricladium varicosporioides]|nr:hypothetical protein BGZ60DRAFT_526404 [Hymenoscyphus varicosporioides]
MASRIQQEANISNGGPPLESSVRDFAVVTDIAAGPIAEHTVDASAAVQATVQHLARGTSPSEEIDLTAEPDSVLYFGQKTQVTQLEVLRAIFWRRRRSRNLTLPIETLELLTHMMDGIVDHMKQQETIQKNMQQRINLLEGENVMLRGSQEKLHRLQTDYTNAGIRIERLIGENQELEEKQEGFATTQMRLSDFNQALRIENKRLKKELHIVAGILNEDTESDTGGSSKKRSRRNASTEATSGDETEPETEGRSQKRARREA